ncbi:MAG: PilZ domain-containing protein [Desulfobacterales bacterium]
MDIYIERRKYRRFKFEAFILHDLLTHQDIYAGKIGNFSKVGLYFESDQMIHPGEEIFLKLKKPPDPTGDDSLPQLPFVVKILWHKSLQASSYRHGYGAQYLDPGDALLKNGKPADIEGTGLQIHQTKADEDPRAYPRRIYNKPLVFDYENQYYRSLVKDISHGGAFIRTKLKISVGKKVIVVIPGSKIRKKSKVKGWIVRRNPEGFAVKFDRRSDRRSGSDRRGKSSRKGEGGMKIKANGIDISYELSGRKEAPVVMLSHSLASSKVMWNPQLAALEPHFRVLRYDMRGHGRSEAPEGPYTLEMLAEDAARLERLVLCDTSAVMPAEAQPILQERMAAARQNGMAGQVDGTLERWFTPEYLKENPPEVEIIRQQIRATPLAGYLGCSEALRGLDYLERLSEIKLPTLIMVGEEDPGTPVAAAEAIHERIAGSRLVVLPDARHLCNIEQAEAFNKALMKFLRQL